MFDNVSRAFIVLASFAFVIAVMGLLGMVLFITTRRRREVGVRKVLGATSKRIFMLLLWDFLRPVVVANCSRGRSASWRRAPTSTCS